MHACVDAHVYVVPLSNCATTPPSCQQRTPCGEPSSNAQKATTCSTSRGPPWGPLRPVSFPPEALLGQLGTLLL
eukprot:9325984-Pyramimonas_sp.AAC.1